MNIILLVLAFILGVVAIFSFQKLEDRSASWVVAAISAVSIQSLIYFWSLALQVPFIIVLLFWLLTSIVILYKQKDALREMHSNYQQNNAPPYLIGLALILISSFLFYRYHLAFGAWDAVAVWNLHAIFLSDPLTWQNLFSENLTWSHPDYPLLISAFIGSFWHQLGSTNPVIPTLFHFGVLLAILIFLFKTIYRKHKLTALICLAILCLDRHFIARTTSEYADSFLALLYLLLTYILLEYSKKKDNFTPLVIGFLASVPLWVKNEGLPVFIVFTVLFILLKRKTLKNILRYALGAIPILLSYFYFKFFIAPENLIVGSQNVEVIFEKITDFSRYKLIFSELIKTVIWTFPFLILIAAFAAIIKLKSKSTINYYPIIFLGLCFISYLFVYLISPYELEWHVQHSITRLIHQVYPAALLVCAYTISIFFNKKEAFIF